MNRKHVEIEKKFNRSQDALVLQQSDLSLKSVSDMVDSQAIDIDPKYQRRKRWDEKRESDLIESFILNIPVPPIYLAEDEYGTYSVIDGKQRITAINNFLNNKLKLHDLDSFEELEGYTFDDLPKAIKNALKIRPYLRVVTLLKQSDGDLKHEVFLRLNKAGVALNSQEIRNVAFRGALNDLLIDLSGDKYFKERIKATRTSKIYREMTDVQYVLRFFTVREYWDDFSGSMDYEMDEFMKNNFHSDRKTLAKYKREFNRALGACNIIWGDSAFLKPHGSQKVLQGYFDIQMVCLSLLNNAQLRRVISKPKKIRRLLSNEILENEEFSSSATQFTSNPRNVRYRISTFLKLLKTVE